MFCSDPISGFHFIAQTCKFLLIDATATTSVKVKERSSSTFSQTYIFFVPDIKGLAQTVLTREGKVIADADADADAAETN